MNIFFVIKNIEYYIEMLLWEKGLIHKFQIYLRLKFISLFNEIAIARKRLYVSESDG